MQCKEERKQTVIPIFYHVDPSEVRNQTGICGEAFTDHEENADEERKEKIRKWRTAMREAGNLAGYDTKSGGIGGGLVWQLMAEGMQSCDDGYEIVLSHNPSTSSVITQQSNKMAALDRV
ncbi:TMV resistance protein N [Vitis vinifera]|uniref:ADP-ribosyl cyclase/cyclic ADP-ribose hydrolase n=1 Tax=Vitis vinifera TaxID=29760 RepID=A0A438FRL0_VITVI|nr:TMV resistance protein N [Vitis vinifera]